MFYIYIYAVARQKVTWADPPILRAHDRLLIVGCQLIQTRLELNRKYKLKGLSVVNNPLLQFEYKRILTMARKNGYQHIWKRVYAVLIFLTLWAIGSLLLFPNVPLVATHQVSFAGVLILIGQAVISLILLQRTLIRATLIAGRERTSAWNWETFVLTGVDARTVIVGKWKAVVQSLWREYMLLGILRAIIFPVALMLHEIHSEYPYRVAGQYSLLDYVPSLANLLFGVVAIFLLTLAQLPLMAAIGVLSASRKANAPAGFGRAFSTWLLVMMGTTLIIVLVFIAYNQYMFYSNDDVSRFFWLAVDSRILETAMLSAMSMADSGILSPVGLIMSIFYSEKASGIGMISFMLVITLYGFLTWASLQLSIRLSQWQGMIKPSSR